MSEAIELIISGGRGDGDCGDGGSCGDVTGDDFVNLSESREGSVCVISSSEIFDRTVSFCFLIKLTVGGVVVVVTNDVVIDRSAKRIPTASPLNDFAGDARTGGELVEAEVGAFAASVDLGSVEATATIRGEEIDTMSGFDEGGGGLVNVVIIEGDVLAFLI